MAQAPSAQTPPQWWPDPPIRLGPCASLPSTSRPLTTSQWLTRLRRPPHLLFSAPCRPPHPDLPRQLGGLELLYESLAPCGSASPNVRPATVIFVLLSRDGVGTSTLPLDSSLLNPFRQGVCEALGIVNFEAIVISRIKERHWSAIALLHGQLCLSMCFPPHLIYSCVQILMICDKYRHVAFLESFPHRFL